jgi:fructose-1,6-bisphosphatase I
MAFIIERAGGIASDGSRRILDIMPSDLHQRSPFFGGSSAMVEELMGYLIQEK